MKLSNQNVIVAIKDFTAAYLKKSQQSEMLWWIQAHTKIVY